MDFLRSSNAYLGYCGSEAGFGYCTEEPACHIHAVSFPGSVNKARWQLKHCKTFLTEMKEQKYFIPMDLVTQCKHIMHGIIYENVKLTVFLMWLIWIW